MTFKKLISLINPVNIYGTPPEQVQALAHDSRKVEQGDVFIAVKGLQTDGHKYIVQAVNRGAAAIICEEVPDDIGQASVIKVADTRSILGMLAQAFQDNPADKLTTVAITGTNGKTTTATLVYQILQQLDTNISLLGTVEKRINDEVLESKLTTADPIELARDMRRMVEAGSTHVVMEVSSHALQQKRVDGIDVDVAAFTNLSHDHLDYHDSMDEYAAAKKLLFDHLSPTAKAIINGDDSYADFMSSDCDGQKTVFSFKENATSSNCHIISNTTGGLQIKVDDTTIKSPLMGHFNAYNIAESFLIGRALGFEKNKIAEALKQAQGAPGRLEHVQNKNIEKQPTVLVDYAHTPGALTNVLQTLNDFKKQQQHLQVIFGCGGDRDKSKRPKMAAIAETYADQVIITSDNPRTEDPNAIIDDAMQGFTQPDNVRRITNRRKAIEQTVSNAAPSAIILIAGKGHETYQEVNGVRHHFDDREIAHKALGAANGNTKTEEAV